MCLLTHVWQGGALKTVAHTAPELVRVLHCFQEAAVLRNPRHTKRVVDAADLDKVAAAAAAAGDIV